MWRCGWSAVCPEPPCRFGRFGACAPAGVWIKAMASATAAVFRLVYVMEAPLSIFSSLFDAAGDRIAIVNDRKLRGSTVYVVRTDRIGPLRVPLAGDRGCSTPPYLCGQRLPEARVDAISPLALNLQTCPVFQASFRPRSPPPSSWLPGAPRLARPVRLPPHPRRSESPRSSIPPPT